jgi:hypothetical protein
MEQLALLPEAHGNAVTLDGMKRFVKNHTLDTRRSMKLMAQTMRCCWFDLFFLDVRTCDIIMYEPRADMDDVNFGSIARRYWEMIMISYRGQRGQQGCSEEQEVRI